MFRSARRHQGQSCNRRAHSRPFEVGSRRVGDRPICRGDSLDHVLRTDRLGPHQFVEGLDGKVTRDVTRSVSSMPSATAKTGGSASIASSLTSLTRPRSVTAPHSTRLTGLRASADPAAAFARCSRQGLFHQSCELVDPPVCSSPRA